MRGEVKTTRRSEVTSIAYPPIDAHVMIDTRP
jgi:hypothetical protein